MPTTLLLSMHPAPYRDPVLSRVQSMVGDRLRIVTLYPQTTHPEWELSEPEYSHSRLRPPVRWGSRVEFHPDIIRVLLAGGYENVIVPGYLPVTSALTALASLPPRRRLIYSADTVHLGGPPPRRGLTRTVARAADAIWTPGAAGRRFWEGQGVPSRSIFEGMYTLSVEEIVAGAGTPADEAHLRREFDLEGRYVYLFVGHSIPSRRLPMLTEAFLNAAASDSALVIIGSGPDHMAIQELAQRHPERRIVLLPAMPFARIHRWYALADAYVHAGAEPYSLAVQEAAVLGVPLVCSDQVGAAYDYLVPGKSGISVADGDRSQLEAAIDAIRAFQTPSEEIAAARKRGVDFAAGQFLAMTGME